MDLTGQRDFAVRLASELASEPGNLFFSPFGAWSLLALLVPGARGETKNLLASVLGLRSQDEGERWIQALKQLTSDLQAGRQASSSTTHRVVDRLLMTLSSMGAQTKKAENSFHLAIANALWIQKGYCLEPDYVEEIAEYLNAQAQELDLVGDPETACEVVNRWADQNTQGKVSQVLEPAEINSLTRLILTNATYFKAAWAKTFDPCGEMPFHLLDGTDIDVPMMSQFTELPYLEQDGLQVVELPYAGVNLSMVIVLPKQIREFEADLTPEAVEQLVGSIDQSFQVDLILPRFEFENGLELTPALQALGLEDLFAASADLSGISSEPGFQIDQIKQATFVRVDEHGTEAAAVTVGHFITGIFKAERVFMMVDRPFWFFIRDFQTGCILFAGRVEDPS